MKCPNFCEEPVFLFKAFISMDSYHFLTDIPIENIKLGTKLKCNAILLKKVKHKPITLFKKHSYDGVIIGVYHNTCIAW